MHAHTHKHISEACDLQKSDQFLIFLHSCQEIFVMYEIKNFKSTYYLASHK
uniref:Uncharacterized protein n=1 Tax=Octopus bimaculoides TaxID=37653 RepID=A0A0L8HTS9_OCTBM